MPVAVFGKTQRSTCEEKVNSDWTLSAWSVTQAPVITELCGKAFHVHFN